MFRAGRVSVRIAIVFRQGKWHRIIMINEMGTKEVMATAKRRVKADAGFRRRAWTEGHKVSVTAYIVREDMPLFGRADDPDKVFDQKRHSPITSLTVLVEGE